MECRARYEYTYAGGLITPFYAKKLKNGKTIAVFPSRAFYCAYLCEWANNLEWKSAGQNGKLLSVFGAGGISAFRRVANYPLFFSGNFMTRAV